ncbi:TRAFAC clade GTPase domain-containing protein [Pseudomonas veronii]|uniref:TRAFAC clade GTPase domain-containing protein n=1 Tax=Pseudomonas veronii TaxID=76761 RepID=UPI002D796472|nr:hypothetical protein [Pseudomonas veronii]WRU62047.1 hypothetical protein VPH48_28195 [Pseudomonas veronii]
MAAEDEDIETIVCANPECRVAETGRCVEGLELDACPHYGEEPEYDEAEGEELEEEDLDQSITLPSAETLSPEDASEILRRGESRVIAVLGPSDSGKTSLIASLYDLFQEGPVAGVEFARSLSLHAFEHACHDARAASRRSVPHMNRTPIGEVNFYHLEIAGVADRKNLVLLLGDRAGEEYRAAADDVSVVAGFMEISRADILTVLVDGERLLDGGRHNLKSDIIMMLQGLHEGGALRPHSRLALILTKYDAVIASDHAERAFNDFNLLLGDIKLFFGNTLAEVESFQLAASPKSNAVSRGTGVSELLTFWLKPIASPRALTSGRPEFGRAFARLMPLDEPVEEPNG